MEYLCIQLHPERLKNPDLDIRYDLPKFICELDHSGFKIEDEGYDYGEEKNYLNIFMSVENIRVSWPVILNYLKSNVILENNVLEGAIVTYHSKNGEYILLSHFDSSVKVDEFT